jgi:5-methylcytosine-specific restriction endonuclease McrA
MSPTLQTLLPFAVIIGALGGIKFVVEEAIRKRGREKRKAYYNEEYLPSDEWQRKRAVVLKRDKFECVHCGARATQVHHRRYARRRIGNEPIEWLVSVCAACHEKAHSKRRTGVT